MDPNFRPKTSRHQTHFRRDWRCGDHDLGCSALISTPKEIAKALKDYDAHRLIPQKWGMGFLNPTFFQTRKVCFSLWKASFQAWTASNANVPFIVERSTNRSPKNIKALLQETKVISTVCTEVSCCLYRKNEVLLEFILI